MEDDNTTADTMNSSMSMMDVVDSSSMHPRDSRNQSLATDLVPGAVPRDDDEEEPTPVKRLDAAFEVVTKQNPLDDAPALQVALRVRPLPPGLAETSCMQIISDRKVHTTTPSTSGKTREGREGEREGRRGWRGCFWDTEGRIEDNETEYGIAETIITHLILPSLPPSFLTQSISRSPAGKSRSSPSTRSLAPKAAKKHSTPKRPNPW